MLESEENLQVIGPTSLFIDLRRVVLGEVKVDQAEMLRLLDLAATELQRVGDENSTYCSMLDSLKELAEDFRRSAGYERFSVAGPCIEAAKRIEEITEYYPIQPAQTEPNSSL
jgi:hypothetical protein